MNAVILAIAGAVVGGTFSAIGLIWSAIRSVNQKKSMEQREQNEQRGQIDVELSSGRSVSINIGSATPEELVSFIDTIKEGSKSSRGQVA
jgi:hypothetical protein